MKKGTILLTLFLLLTSLASCDGSVSEGKNQSSASETPSEVINSDASSEEIKQFSLLADFSFDIPAPDEATLLIGYANFFFNPNLYGYEKIIAGDQVTIFYTGTFMVLEIFPSIYDTTQMEIKTIEVIRPNIIEYVVMANPGGGTSLYTSDERYHSNVRFLVTNVVEKDRSYKHYNNYPVGTKLYGINPATAGHKNITAFYAYNPLT